MNPAHKSNAGDPDFDHRVRSRINALAEKIENSVVQYRRCLFE
jgi:hypothetical protein